MFTTEIERRINISNLEERIRTRIEDSLDNAFHCNELSNQLLNLNFSSYEEIAEVVAPDVELLVKEEITKAQQERDEEWRKKVKKLLYDLQHNIAIDLSDIDQLDLIGDKFNGMVKTEARIIHELDLLSKEGGTE